MSGRSERGSQPSRHWRPVAYRSQSASGQGEERDRSLRCAQKRTARASMIEVKRKEFDAELSSVKRSLPQTPIMAQGLMVWRGFHEILHRCCEAASSGAGHDPLKLRSADRSPRRSGFTRGGLDVMRVIVPGAILALMPKCPACLAAYFVIGTGVGLSLCAASYLHMLLVTLCVAWLSYLGAMHGRRFIGWRFPSGASIRENGPPGLKHSLE